MYVMFMSIAVMFIKHTQLKADAEDQRCNAGSICDSQIGKLGRFLRVCLQRQRGWPRGANVLRGSAGHTFLYHRPLSEVVGSHCFGCWGKMTRVHTYNRLPARWPVNRLKGIGMNTGRARWDLRIEKGAGCLWEGLARNVHHGKWFWWC